MSSIKDVAKLSGLSVGTVSRYLNSPEQLKPATRMKVRNAIELLGYKPNIFARNLRTQDSKTIAMITQDISNPYYETLFSHIRSMAYSQLYNIFLISLEDKKEDFLSFLRNIETDYLSGLFLCYFQSIPQSVKYMISSINFPTVYIGDSKNFLEEVAPNKLVYVDIFTGYYDATKYLLANGFRKFTYIGCNLDDDRLNAKQAGFEKALSESGLSPLSVINMMQSHNLEVGYLAGKQLLSTDVLPEVILSDSDILSVGIIRCLKDHNFRIPQDISIISCDDLPISNFCEPRLTTIHIPVKEMGNKAFELMMDQIHNRESDLSHRAFKTDLVLRDSVNLS